MNDIPCVLSFQVSSKCFGIFYYIFHANSKDNHLHDSALFKKMIHYSKLDEYDILLKQIFFLSVRDSRTLYWPFLIVFIHLISVVVFFSPNLLIDFILTDIASHEYSFLFTVYLTHSQVHSVLLLSWTSVNLYLKHHRAFWISLYHQIIWISISSSTKLEVKWR